MKIKFETTLWDNYGYDARAEEITTDFGWRLSASENMEPEDARFYRDLPDISTIKELLHAVIAAVKRGEEIIIEEVEVREE